MLFQLYGQRLGHTWYQLVVRQMRLHKNTILAFSFIWSLAIVCLAAQACALLVKCINSREPSIAGVLQPAAVVLSVCGRSCSPKSSQVWRPA